jgi:hypothetical protein
MLLVAVGLRSDPAPVQADTLTASDQLRWYRGNMHTHSHWSDGDDYLESIAAWYQKAGYQFLVFTDHNVLADKERWVDIAKSKGKQPAFDKLKQQFPDWIEERTVEDRHEVRLRRFDEVAQRFNSPEKYLLIQGEEVSDRFEKYPLHFNVSNLKEVITPRGGDSVSQVIQNNVDAAIAQRERTGQPMIIHLNHPNFGYAVTAEDLLRIIGEKFFEIYNGHPGVHNSGDHQHAGCEPIWDIVLTKRLAELKLPVMYGLAVDDGHEYHHIPSRAAEPGRGWVMVLAKELTAAALIEALEAGQFYSSSGVRLSRVESSEAGLMVEVDAVPGETYTIEFIGTRKGYDPEGKSVLDDKGTEVRTTRRYSPDIGAVLKTVQGTQARYEMTGDEIYVRARITSSALHPNPSEPGEFQRAWVQPVVGPAGRR